MRKNVEYFVRPPTRETLPEGSHPSCSSAEARSAQCIPTELVSFFFTLKATLHFPKGGAGFASPHLPAEPLWELLCLCQAELAGTCPALPVTRPAHSQGLQLRPAAMGSPLGIIVAQQQAHHLGRNFLGEVTKPV